MKRLLAYFLLTLGLVSGVGAQQDTIQQFLRETPRFAILSELVEEAGLAELLQQDGPFTMLVPPDHVFAELPGDTLTALRNDPELLEYVISHHIIEAEMSVINLLDLETMEVQAMSGEDLHIDLEDGLLRVDDAAIVSPDYETGNGIVHEVDGLLMPPEPEEPENN